MFYTASHKIGEKRFENVVHAAQSVTSQIQAIVKENCGNEYVLISEAPLPNSSMSAALYSLDTLIINEFESHVVATYNPATLRTEKVHGHKYEKKESVELATRYLDILSNKGYTIESVVGTKKKLFHDCAEAFIYAQLYLRESGHSEFQFDNSEHIKAYKERMKNLKKREKELLKEQLTL